MPQRGDVGVDLLTLACEGDIVGEDVCSNGLWQVAALRHRVRRDKLSRQDHQRRRGSGCRWSYAGGGGALALRALAVALRLVCAADKVWYQLDRHLDTLRLATLVDEHVGVLDDRQLRLDVLLERRVPL